MAIAAKMPMMATTIISSIRVKPRWFPRAFLFFFQNAVIVRSPVRICGLTKAHLEKCRISEEVRLHPGCQGLPVRKDLISWHLNPSDSPILHLYTGLRMLI